MSVYTYDFKRQEPVSKKNKNAISHIYRIFAKDVSQTLSTQFQIPIVFELEALEQVPLSQYLHWLTYPTCITTINIPSLNSHIILEISTIISYAAISIMLGQESEISNFSYTLSNLEMAIYRKFISLLFKKLELAWAPIQDIHLTINEISASVETLKEIPGDISYLVARFSITWSDIHSQMTLAMPIKNDQTLNDALANFSEEEFSSPGQTPEQIEDSRTIDAGHIILELKACLGRISLPGSELQELKAGDVLTLDHKANDLVDICIGQESAFQGSLGVIGKYKGILVK
jgi:flagellar motor switch protein FliM